MYVFVTQQHIDWGVRYAFNVGRPESPLQFAIEEALKAHCLPAYPIEVWTYASERLRYGSATLFYEDQRVTAELPESALQFDLDWKEGKEVKPFSFALSLRDPRLEWEWS